MPLQEMSASKACRRPATWSTSSGASEGTRTLHHRGVGAFAVDGQIIDLRTRMMLWKSVQD